jgi:uncharacterized protein (TIGR03382 family)
VQRTLVVLALGALSCWVAVSVQPSSVYAYSRGVSFSGCTGCHSNGSHDVDVTLTPATVSPGARATVRITVRGSGVVAGLYADVSDGTVESTGGGVARTEGGITHDGPRSVSGGAAVFEFAWTAPSSPGSVRFDISSVLGNGNGRSSGDGAVDAAAFDFVYGCEPATYYRDFDGDGHGQMRLPRVHCAGGAPTGYAATGDDCNDSDDRAYPGAADVCNGRDDDCNGIIDDNAEPVDHYPDADGDGYYSRAERESGETFFGCGPMGGRWAANPGDCAPNDPAINPGAEDVCNGLDDDCDGDVDERVRPQCGQGWCRRNAFSCEPEDCTPGDPRDESCNYFDDDCDGAVDEDACPSGQVCVEFECVVGTMSDRDGGGIGPSTPPPATDDSCAGCGSGGRLSGVITVSAFALLALWLRRRRR